MQAKGWSIVVAGVALMIAPVAASAHCGADHSQDAKMSVRPKVPVKVSVKHVQVPKMAVVHVTPKAKKIVTKAPTTTDSPSTGDPTLVINGQVASAADAIPGTGALGVGSITSPPGSPQFALQAQPTVPLNPFFVVSSFTVATPIATGYGGMSAPQVNFSFLETPTVSLGTGGPQLLTEQQLLTAQAQTSADSIPFGSISFNRLSPGLVKSTVAATYSTVDFKS